MLFKPHTPTLLGTRLDTLEHINIFAKQNKISGNRWNQWLKGKSVESDSKEYRTLNRRILKFLNCGLNKVMAKEKIPQKSRQTPAFQSIKISFLSVNQFLRVGFVVFSNFYKINSLGVVGKTNIQICV